MPASWFGCGRVLEGDIGPGMMFGSSRVLEGNCGSDIICFDGVDCLKHCLNSC